MGLLAVKDEYRGGLSAAGAGFRRGRAGGPAFCVCGNEEVRGGKAGFGAPSLSSSSSFIVIRLTCSERSWSWEGLKLS